AVRRRDERLRSPGRRIEPDGAEEPGEVDLHTGADWPIDDVLQGRDLNDRLDLVDDHRVVRHPEALDGRAHLARRANVRDPDVNAVRRLVIVDVDGTVDGEGAIGCRVLPALELLPSEPRLANVECGRGPDTRRH